MSPLLKRHRDVALQNISSQTIMEIAGFLLIALYSLHFFRVVFQKYSYVKAIFYFFQGRLNMIILIIFQTSALPHQLIHSLPKPFFVRDQEIAFLYFNVTH